MLISLRTLNTLIHYAALKPTISFTKMINKGPISGCFQFLAIEAIQFSVVKIFNFKFFMIIL